MRRTIQDSFHPIVYQSVEDFTDRFTTSIPSCGIVIGDSLPVQMRWINRNAPTTIVCFSAAVNPKVQTIPIFSGWKMTGDLESNVLMVSDPSLVLSTRLRMGWYAGNEHQPNLQQMLTNIFNVFAAATRLIFFGASGGGYAALEQAPRFPGSTALVSNPQTDFTLRRSFPLYMETCWSDTPTGGVPPVTTSILEAYKQPLDAKVVYVQNSEDTEHVVRHFEPFMAHSHPANTILALTPELGDGHVGPDPRSFTDLLRVMERETDWDALSADLAEVHVTSRFTAVS